MTDDRSPHPRRGVLGYIAEFQQLDETVVIRPQEPAGFIDLGVPRPAPVTHRGRRPKRRALLWVVAGAAVLTGGIGYAVLRDPSPAPSASPRPAAPVVPSASPTPTLFGPETVPGLDPVATTRAASKSAIRTATAVVTSAPRPTKVRVTTTSPPAPSPTVTTDAPALTATYTYAADEESFVGTVRIANASAADIADWNVRLIVPEGNEVTIRAGDVAVSRDGAAVAFAPADDAEPVPAAGSVTFEFEVVGPLAALPAGCTVDGLACG